MDTFSKPVQQFISSMSQDKKRDGLNNIAESCNNPKFQKKQKAFFKEGTLFDAVVILDSDYNVERNDPHDSSPPQSKWSYLIHFVGWNSRWDKWVPESGLYVDSAEHRKKALDSKQQQKESWKQHLKLKKGKKKKQGKAFRKEESSNDDKLESKEFKTTTKNIKNDNPAKQKSTNSMTKKRKKDNLDDRRSTHDSSSIPLCENLPLTLKIELVNDEEQIMRLGSVTSHGYDPLPPTQPSSPSSEEFSEPTIGRLLPQLPCKLTVHQVLNDYLMQKLQNNKLSRLASQSTPLPTVQSQEPQSNISNSDETKLKNSHKSWTHFISSLLLLFDRTLPHILLYPPERIQFLLFQESAKLRPCEIYGCQYLLRFFTRLPHLFSQLDFQHEEQSNPPKETNCSTLVMVQQRFKNKISNIHEKINDLIRYLQQNKSKCFRFKYRAPVEKEYLPHEIIRFKNNSNIMIPSPTKSSVTTTIGRKNKISSAKKKNSKGKLK